MSDQTPFDPFQKNNQNGKDNSENPQNEESGQFKRPENEEQQNTNRKSGYGSFGREDSFQEGENKQNFDNTNGTNYQGRNGSFFGPDYFSQNGINYGANQQPPRGAWGNRAPREPYVTEKQRGFGFGVASLICGILSILCCCAYGWFQLILAVAGIAFGIVQSKMDKKTSGMSIAGIVTAAIGAILAIVILIVSLSGAVDVFLEEMQKAMEDAYGQSSSGADMSGLVSRFCFLLTQVL